MKPNHPYLLLLFYYFSANQFTKTTFLWVNLCFILLGNVLYAQENTTLSIADSLNIYQNHKEIARSSTYAMIEIATQKFKKNHKIYSLYGNIYIQKAKEEGDTIEIANGYNLMYKNNASNYRIAMQYVDSIIEITKGIKHKYYPSRGYLDKGTLLYKTNHYKEALEYYLKAESYAKKNKNISHQIVVKHNIGRLKNILNKHEEALNTYKENLKFLRSNEFENEHEVIFIGTLYGLSDSYNKLNKIDSADFYIRKGIKESLKSDDKYFYSDFLLEFGINNTLKENHVIALDTLYKLEKLLPNIGTEVNRPICHTYIGKNLYKLNKKEEALIYLKKVDSAIHLTNYIPELRDAFELLISHYKKEGDDKSQLKLLEKLIILDSASNQQYKKLDIDIVKNYDTSLLVHDRDLLIDKLSRHKKKFIKNTYTIVTIVFGIVLIFFFWYYKKQRLWHKNMKMILEEKQQIIQNRILQGKIKKDLEVPKQILIELSDKLKDFENTYKFLKKDITLISLAKALKTNSTYLSKVINKTTGKNFANYINDLRIDYAMKKLHDEPKFKLFSIAAIAEEAGFNNAKSFSRAFLKKTGENPSDFIKDLI